jgi:hypothetical protein
MAFARKRSLSFIDYQIGLEGPRAISYRVFRGAWEVVISTT